MALLAASVNTSACAGVSLPALMNAFTWLTKARNAPIAAVIFPWSSFAMAPTSLAVRAARKRPQFDESLCLSYQVMRRLNRRASGVVNSLTGWGARAGVL